MTTITLTPDELNIALIAFRVAIKDLHGKERDEIMALYERFMERWLVIDDIAVRAAASR